MTNRFQIFLDFLRLSGSEFLWHKKTRLDLIFQSTNGDEAFSVENFSLRTADLEQAEANRIQDEEARRLKTWVPRKSRPVAANFKDIARVPVHRASVVSGNWIALDSLAPRKAQNDSVKEGWRGEDVSCSSSNFALETKPTFLHVSTLNVLHDTYLPTSVKALTQSRWRAVADEICGATAMFYVLTEATREFANFLLSDERIKTTYSSSDGPGSDFKTLPPTGAATGQLVLIRRDVEVKHVFFTTTSESSGKRLVFIAGRLPCGTSVALTALHLTSGQIGASESAPAVEKRRQQLEFVLKRVSSIEVDPGKLCTLQVLAGDFNFHDADDFASKNLLEGFTEAAPGMHCPTFDPSRNGLAAINSSHRNEVRLDRIYVRDATPSADGTHPTMSVVSHALILAEPILPQRPFFFDKEMKALLPAGMHASDHFGVTSIFAQGGCLPRVCEKSGWTKDTALAILPE